MSLYFVWKIKNVNLQFYLFDIYDRLAYITYLLGCLLLNNYRYSILKYSLTLNLGLGLYKGKT